MSRPSEYPLFFAISKGRYVALDTQLVLVLVL
jgi:hypothetical protein